MEYETYSESAEGVMIGKARVAQELDKHGCGDQAFAEFANEYPSTNGKWNAGDVLRFLGY